MARTRRTTPAAPAAAPGEAPAPRKPRTRRQQSTRPAYATFDRPDGPGQPERIDVAGVDLPAKALVHVPIDKLAPYGNNPRKHPERQILDIADSLERFGWTNPVLITAGNQIIAGHGRVMAARRILEGGRAIAHHPDPHAIPCLRLDNLTVEEARAYVIADNQLAAKATWDLDLLTNELRELQRMDKALVGLVGFDEKELFSFLNDPEGGAGTVTGEESGPPVTRPGDVWLLGKHRLLCGSATDPGAVARVLAGAVPPLMVTDPPYGVNYDPQWRRKGLAHTSAGRDGRVVRRNPNAFLAAGEIVNDHQASWLAAWELFPGDVAYVWHGGLHAGTVSDDLLQAGFEMRAQVIWKKSHFAIGRGDYHWGHEACWYAVRQGHKSHWCGSRKEQTVWEITNQVGFTTKTEGEDGRTGHGSQKPIECMARPILNNSKKGGLVYDPFCGSGSTLIAAQKHDRVALCIELKPAYVDLIVRRWEKFAGAMATLEGDGRTFQALERERSLPPDEPAAAPGEQQEGAEAAA